MKDPAPLLSVSFVISGRDFDPATCTEAIGLIPTATWKQRREHLRARLDLHTDEWIFGFEKEPLYSTDEAVADVLNLVWPARERIRNFLATQDLKVSMTCSVTIHQDRPLYELSAAVMEKLSWLGCEFGLDIYDYSD